ncbi:MAG: hypothetical protein ACREON_00570 [Gemmatimonadaceae bacterium]
MTGKATVARDGLLRSEAAKSAWSRRIPASLFLGRRDWADDSGTLVLVPPSEFVDSIHAGHLAYRWKSGGSDIVVSLHAWEPFLETEAALRLIVESIDRD